MNNSEQLAESTRQAYDTLVHKLARAGWLQHVVKALVFGPVPVGMGYAAKGAGYGVEVNIATPIGVAHIVFLAIALVLFSGMVGGPGLTANIRALNAIRKSELEQCNPRGRASITTQSVMIAGYAILAVPMLVGMSLGEIVGSEVVRWVSTSIGWVVFGAIALLIHHANNLAARRRSTIARPVYAPGVETVPPPEVMATEGHVESLKTTATPSIATRQRRAPNHADDQ